jgi:hypothetical protein
MSRIAKALAIAPATLMLAAGMLMSPPATKPANAQYAAMSCNALWYARNEIYARNGYCFRTARARSVFGRGCFPPYGRLSPYEQRQVSQIESWEYRRGCR